MQSAAGPLEPAAAIIDQLGVWLRLRGARDALARASDLITTSSLGGQSAREVCLADWTAPLSGMIC